ncbi:MAG: M15 family metallopeptidase [Actinobacteria bacterium]|nr:M15 family metallopeptidase [Actinomycetota bacterium]
MLGGAVAVTGAVTAPPVSELQAYRITGSVTPPPEVPVDASVPPPAQISALPAPTFQDAAPAGVDLCAMPAFSAALAAHDDAAAITAAGGADAFRTAVATGTAPCVPLNDPSHVWVVVNKLRPFDPLDYVPKPLGLPNGVRSLEGGELRTDAATGLATMVAAAKQAGVGEIALESGYRSYVTQKKNFGSGGASVEASVARPGYSEHQSGLAGDLVACANGCGTLDAVAATPQGQWLTAHSWEYGWIVRYEEGRTATTGYIPEAWHFRYIGVDLARAYHGGSWHTLEEFFGLPAAPDYAN